MVKYDLEKRSLFLANRDNRENIPSFKSYFWKADEETGRIWSIDSVTPSKSDVINTYKYMCRNHFRCLELADRRVKRLGLVGMLGYTKSSNPKKISKGNGKRKGAFSDDQRSKRTRTTEITCSTKPPTIRGRRENPCRICGYAIKKNCIPAVLDCCNEKAHPICWHNATAAFRSKKGSPKRLKCYMISNLLSKGGLEPIGVITTSASQPVVSSPRSTCRATRTQPPAAGNSPTDELAPCPFCGKMLSLNDKRHALTECTRLNQLFDPGGVIDDHASIALTPLAAWCASMSRVDSLAAGT